jgi:hypothetical protein
MKTAKAAVLLLALPNRTGGSVGSVARRRFVSTRVHHDGSGCSSPPCENRTKGRYDL